MMIKEETLYRVIDTYIEKEIAPLSNGTSQINQLLFGFQVGILRRKAKTLISQYIESPVAKTMGLIDEQNQVDIDTLYGALSDAMTSQGNIELMGVKFTTQDVNKLYSMLKEASNE